uniref:Uncharacterized protein n=1 Tax=Mycena chlorophos TaxID=658473 RepID=A0ABQ0L2W4_MYCCL|nr:predicted protein [Mycena chlorophos]
MPKKKTNRFQTWLLRRIRIPGRFKSCRDKTHHLTVFTDHYRTGEKKFATVSAFVRSILFELCIQRSRQTQCSEGCKISGMKYIPKNWATLETEYDANFPGHRKPVGWKGKGARAHNEGSDDSDSIEAEDDDVQWEEEDRAPAAPHPEAITREIVSYMPPAVDGARSEPIITSIRCADLANVDFGASATAQIIGAFPSGQPFSYRILDIPLRWWEPLTNKVLDLRFQGSTIVIHHVDLVDADCVDLEIHLRSAFKSAAADAKVLRKDAPGPSASRPVKRAREDDDGCPSGSPHKRHCNCTVIELD